MAAETFRLERCPHCGSDASVERNLAFRYKCRACGKPRIPLDATLATTDERTLGELRTAYSQRLARFAWQFGALGAVFASVLSALLGLGAAALFDLGLMTGSVAVAFTLLPLLAAVGFFSASKRADQRSRDALDAAWDSAARHLYSATNGEIDNLTLARSLGIDPEAATELLARAEVDQLLSGADAPAPRMRVAVPSERVKHVDATSRPDDASVTENDEVAALRELERELGEAPTEQFARSEKPQ